MKPGFRGLALAASVFLLAPTASRPANYTVIGDCVNPASRLEGLTKRYGISIIASDSSRRAAPEYVFRELDRVRVKGKTEAVRIYEPLGARETLSAAVLEARERFDRAQELIRAREWDSARRELSGLAEQADGVSDGPLYEVYLERIETYVADPPGPGWDGTVEYTRK